MGEQIDLEQSIAEAEFYKDMEKEEQSVQYVNDTNYVSIPEDYFYANLSLWALGLICHITVKEEEIALLAKKNNLTFDKAVMESYSREFGVHIFRSAMSELVASGLYEYNDGTEKTTS